MDTLNTSKCDLLRFSPTTMNDPALKKVKKTKTKQN